MLNVIKHRTALQALVMIGLPMMLTSGCTWVKKTPAAEQVRIVPKDRVADCTRLGNVTTYTKDKISIVSRGAEKVQSELQSLAQIDAAEMGGDTITAESRPVEGQQSFSIYRCL